MAINTITTTNSEAIKNLYSKDFLLPYDGILRLYEMGQKTPIPWGANEGGTLKHTRWLQLVRPTSALTAADKSGTTNPYPRSFYTQEISTTLELWGDYMELQDIYNFQKINPGIRVESQLQGQQSAEVLEEQTCIKNKYNGIPVRSDVSSTYEKHFVPVSTGSSTTAFTVTTLPGLTTNADFANGWVVFDNPQAEAFADAREVSTYNTTTGVFAVAALSKTPSTTSGRVSTISVGTDTSLNTLMSGVPIRKAVRLLRTMRVPTFPNGFYAGVLDPDTLDDMTQDADWKAAQIYRTDQDGIFKNTIKQLWGVNFVMSNFSHRWDEATHTTYSATGALHTVPILGQKAFGVVDAKGQGLKVIVKNYDQVGDPLDRFMTMGWKVLWNVTPLNPTCCANIMTAVSSV
jgi:hypothetical protein